MYFFLTYLSFIDASLTSVTTPKLINDLLYQRRTISWGACLTQLFMEQFLAASEVILLIVMSYDHYVAICKLLHYTAIMRQGLCHLLMVVTWIGEILHATPQILFTVDLTFCDSNVIDHLMCDFFSLLELACSDIYWLGIVVAANTGGMSLFISSMLLLISHIVILSSLKSHGFEGRCKALSTYGFHFTVVVLSFVPCIFTYTCPVATYPTDKWLTVFFGILTSMLNPIIYAVRNAEVKNAIRPQEDVTSSIGLLTPPNNVTEFILLGLTQNPHLQETPFIVFLFIFPFTVLTSLLIVITVSPSPTPSAPMYFFLTHLSFIDVSFTSVTTPKMISDLLYQRRTISCEGCLTQLFVGHLLGGSDTIVLTVMAYDHYVAICKPLHYTTIMQQGLCQLLALLDWIGGILHATVQILFMMDLTFCGPNVTDHFMCDFFSLSELACSNTYRLGMVVAANSGGMCLLIFFMLLISYTVILSSLKSHGSEGQHKSFSTCGSHFTVMVLFFVPCIFTHLRPVATYPADKLVTVFFAILSPMLNPVIYTARNTEVKIAMRSLLKKIVT
ncbi:olfactory receptor 140-like [Hippopotamus amphibius kiboko]|uniref:olfactory receptor 140-like n=1 Tax=Hippopotamus amphibius kiboko TaxID=575201 RepID=UPI0025989962|nr:olfactory receptor 140-like [Hippopotamus amphibius kiboko]